MAILLPEFACLARAAVLPLIGGAGRGLNRVGNAKNEHKDAL